MMDSNLVGGVRFVQRAKIIRLFVFACDGSQRRLSVGGGARNLAGPIVVEDVIRGMTISLVAGRDA